MNNRDKTSVKDEKLKPLRPSLRVKKRFLLLNIHSSKQFSESELSKGLSSFLLEFLGVKTFGDSGFWFLKDKFNFKEQTAVVKISLSTQKDVVGALGFLEQIQGIPTRVDVVRISGTLKGLEKN
jgi:RNase P/RNase MRP subunit POP5